MTQQRDLLHGTVLYGATEVLNRSLLFLLLPLFTRFLSPADFGISAMVASLSVLLVPVVSLGLGGGLAPCYFADKTEDHKNATISTAMAIVGFSGAVSVAAGISASDVLGVILFGRAEFGHLVVLGVAATAFTVVAIPLRQRLQFDGRAKLYVALSFVSAVVTTVATVVTLVVLKRGVKGVLEANLISQAMTFGLFAAPSLFVMTRRLRIDLARRLLSVGLPLIPAFASLFLLQHASRYLLQWNLGLDAVGIFTVGQNIGLVVSVLVTGFQGAWLPFFMAYADRPTEASGVLGRVTTYYVLGFGTFSLALCAAARLIVLVMTSPPFFEAWRVVGPSATTQVLNGLFLVLLPGMYYAGEVKYVGLVQGLAAALSVVINIVLIRLFGVFGAAVAMPFSFGLLVAFQYVWNVRRGYALVAYEWPRLRNFLWFYLLFAAAMLVSRNLSIAGEAVLSLAGVAIAMAFALAQLKPGERQVLWSSTAGLLGGTMPAQPTAADGTPAEGVGALGSGKAAS